MLISVDQSRNSIIGNIFIWTDILCSTLTEKQQFNQYLKWNPIPHFNQGRSHNFNSPLKNEKEHSL